MKRTAGVVLALTLVALVLSPARSALAQETRLVTGVVVGYQADSAGALVSFDIIDSQGELHEFSVRGGENPTEYGLENQAGDRWVATQASEPVEVVRRLQDHQQRFAPVTVQAEGDVALSVVETESGRLETNLGFLFAVYAVSWAAFFAYVFYVSRKQRDLQRELARLRQRMEHTPNQS